MPAAIATPPTSCIGPTGLANKTAPVIAPTSGSRFTNAPATSAGTLLCPKANNEVGSTVPSTMSPPTASIAVALGEPTAGRLSVSRASGSVAAAAAISCTAVVAIGSCPRSTLACETVKPAEASWEARTRPSPASVEPAPWPAVMKPTPASDNANPAQASGRATLCPSTAASSATSTGVAPMSNAAWVTLVRSMPRFCRTTEPPYPAAPLIRIAGRQTARSRNRLTAIRMSPATANLVSASQPGASQPRASFDRGTVVPHRTPAVIRAGKTVRRLLVMPKLQRRDSDIRL
jgi:hypothetical protein